MLVETKSKEVLRLWLRMLSTTTQVEQQLKRLLRENFDITLAQFDLMAELARVGEPKTMSEISQMLMVSNGNVTGVVDRLSREGLVERLPLETDRRAYLLALTPEGEKRFKMMAQAHETWLEQIFGEISLKDINMLSKKLKFIRDTLELGKP
jgi:DNA-binding MarR family transcriptional regulator